MFFPVAHFFLNLAFGFCFACHAGHNFLLSIYKRINTCFLQIHSLFLFVCLRFIDLFEREKEGVPAGEGAEGGGR